MNVVDTALVIDDDFLMRGYVVDSLQREGIIAMEACSIEEARRMLDYHHFDLVFSDRKLVGSDVSTLKNKSLKPERESLHVIMTSFAAVEQAVETVNNGAYDYLIKPFSPEQVSLVVSRARELLALRTQTGTLEMQAGQARAAGDDSTTTGPEFEIEITTNLRELERKAILHVMEETGGNRKIMASKLGVSVRTLQNKLNQYRQEDRIFQL